MRNPHRSTGWVIRTRFGRSRFAGTCFAFRRPCFLLTAAHCVKDVDPGELSVSIMTDNVEQGLQINHVTCHDRADVALLELAVKWHPMFDPFLGETSTYDWGVPVSAFGYPEDTGASGMEPTPRYFRGNIQRVFRHRSPLGFE